MQARGEGAASFFDRTAATYAGARYGARARPFHRAFFGTRLRYAAAALDHLPSGSLVVDVGCGPSPLAPALRARGIRVVGLDFSPGMLAEARRAGALPVQADATVLPLRGGCADGMLVLGVTTYLEDPAPLLREAARVLRPGGTLVVTATNAGAPDTVVRALARRVAGLRRRGGERELLLAGVPVHAHRPAAFEEALRAAGLEPVGRRGHNFTVFPLGRVLEGPSLALSAAAEAAGLPPSLASDTVFTARRPGAAPPRRARPPRPLRVARVIARLNVGGPALHVALLSEGLDRRGFLHVLLAGRCEPGEADMSDVAAGRGVATLSVPGLGRSVSPREDAAAFLRLWSRLRRFRPHVLHTHTAKAGALGRVAGVLCGVPLRVHTFHGHVFHGYFGPAVSRAVALTERALALLTHRVLAVSEEVRRDLVDGWRIAPPGKVTVVPLGLDLAPFARAAAGEGRGALRAGIGAAPDTPLVGIVGRMVPVKEHGFFLEAAATLLRDRPDTRFVLVGSGPLEPELRERARALGIDDRCAFLGWRRDTAAIAADLDVLALTSRNEGTPVALIEGAAAGCRLVARDVGGIASALAGVEGATLVPAAAPPAEFARALAAALDGARSSPRRADAGVLRRFSVDRLCDDVERIYRGGPSSG